MYKLENTKITEKKEKEKKTPHHGGNTSAWSELRPGAVAVTVGAILVVRAVLDHAEPLLSRQREVVPGNVVREGVPAPGFGVISG